MKSSTVALLTMALAVAACRTKANPESCLVTPCGLGLRCDMVTQACVARDGGVGVDAGGPQGSIVIVTPAGPTSYANSTIAIEVDLGPGSPVPASVDILKDGATLATITSAPPYTTQWDTTKDTEGAHQIAARATFSGHVVMAPAVTVVVDRKPPTITAQTPLNGAQNALLSDPITVQFSEPLDAKTVTPSSVSLTTTDGPVPATTSLSADGTTVTIVVTERSRLTFPALVTETVAATVADLAGNQLGTAGNWTWTAPRWVTLASFPGQMPSLAIGPDDHPIVSYLAPAGGVGIAKYATGAVWDVSIPSPATATIAAAAIAVDPNGAPLVAWSAGHTFVAKWTGTSWDTNAYGNVPDTGVQGAVTDLKLDRIGEPTVAWSSRPAACQMCAQSAFVARWNQAAWQALFSGTTASGAGTALVQIDSTGSPAMISHSSGGFGIQRYAGGSWLAVDTSGVAGGPAAVADTLALDSQDRPVVVAEVSQGPTTFQVQYLAGGAWSNVGGQEVSGNAAAPNEVHLVLDHSDKPTLVWSEVASGEQRLRVAKVSATGWDASYDALSGFFGSGTDAGNAAVVLDKAGAPVVAWQEYSGPGGTASIFMWRANR